jgi:hypothetical protein
MSRNLGALTLLDPSGPAWPVMGVLYLYCTNGSFQPGRWYEDDIKMNLKALGCEGLCGVESSGVG